MQFKLFGSFCALAIFSASVLGAALSQEDGSALQVYTDTNYQGLLRTISFTEGACTPFPELLQLRSIQIPGHFDCSFYDKVGCRDGPVVHSSSSIPDVSTPLRSFRCNPIS